MSLDLSGLNITQPARAAAAVAIVVVTSRQFKYMLETLAFGDVAAFELEQPTSQLDDHSGRCAFRLVVKLASDNCTKSIIFSGALTESQ